MAAADHRTTYDVAVIGIGLIGSGALRALADEGVSCIGVGPAEPADWSTHPGPFASHFDSGRITRHLDPVREWAVLAARAIAGYGDLERRSGIEFHRPVGVVLADLDAARHDAIAAVAAELGVATEVYAAGELDSFDPRLAFTPGTTLTAEGAPAGHVDPRRMLRANLAVAEAAGAAILREAATAIEHNGAWQITTASGDVVRADRVVVATGAHSDELRGLDGCPSFDVRGETIVMATLGAAEQERLAGMPSVLAILDDPIYEDLYVVPPTDYPDGSVRLKLGATRHEPFAVNDAAARRAWMQGDAHATELDDLRALLTALVPGLAADAWETKPCLITETASGLPVVDHLAPHLVLAAGGNGYAAKSANAIGALAARLVLDGHWTDDQLDHRKFGATRIADR